MPPSAAAENDSVPDPDTAPSPAAPAAAPSPPPRDAEWLVACLCAAWCDTCRAYEATFAAAGARLPLPPGGLRWAWVDIEDHDDALGAIDIDDFPTLLIARGERVLFYGAVLPHAATLDRLVERALHAELPSAVDAPPGLAARVRAIIPR